MFTAINSKATIIMHVVTIDSSGLHNYCQFTKLLLLPIDNCQQQEAPLPSTGIPSQTQRHHQEDIETEPNEAYVLQMDIAKNDAYMHYYN